MRKAGNRRLPHSSRAGTAGSAPVRSTFPGARCTRPWLSADDRIPARGLGQPDKIVDRDQLQGRPGLPGRTMAWRAGIRGSAADSSCSRAPGARGREYAWRLMRARRQALREVLAQDVMPISLDQADGYLAPGAVRPITSPDPGPGRLPTRGARGTAERAARRRRPTSRGVPRRRRSVAFRVAARVKGGLDSLQRTLYNRRCIVGRSGCWRLCERGQVPR
jgi:hypothetical protein